MLTIALAASNMHGIVYMADDDRLIVSDVADPASADDGSIYVFDSASSLSGAVTPSRTLRGAATHLGNPVDLALMGDTLYVAEKANEGGRILVFEHIAHGVAGDVSPDGDFALAAPESLMTADVMHEHPADVSDLTHESIRRLQVTSNGAGMGTQVFRVGTDLNSVGSAFTPVQNGQFVESLILDNNGDAVVSFDDNGSPSMGGLSFVNRLNKRGFGSLDAMHDRQLMGANTGLVAPKGVEIAGARGMVMVADMNAAAPGAIRVFSSCATNNAAPLFVTTLPGMARPWDMDYDPDADRLYVASTDGTILVYDDYLANPQAAPARIIDPDDKSGFPTAISTALCMMPCMTA
ncbi:MAG: hypothetical protein R3E89_03085 [Thiolinea sp.]